MDAEPPQVPRLANGRAGQGFWRCVFGPACHITRLARFLEDEVDLRHLEPGQFDIDVEFDQPL
jgi:hypothetical protein